MEIAKEILRQLGGQGRLKLFIAARGYVALKDGLQFRFARGNDGINMVEIRLNARDLYDVRFLKQRGYVPAVEVAKDENVFVGDLVERFRQVSGLALRL